MEYRGDIWGIQTDGQPEGSRNAVSAIQNVNEVVTANHGTKLQPSVQQTFMAMQAQFPNVTFDVYTLFTMTYQEYIQKQYDRWPAPRPPNIEQLIGKQLFYGPLADVDRNQEIENPRPQRPKCRHERLIVMEGIPPPKATVPVSVLAQALVAW